MKKIIEEITIKDGMFIMDVGCGDASFFRMLLEEKPIKKNLTLIGVLPSEEEVNRVKKYIAKNFKMSRAFLRYFKAEPIS